MKKLNRTLVITGGLALSGMIVASLAVAGNFGHHNKRGHFFSAASLDADGDGSLTRDEMLAHNRIRFDKLDSDGNGTISPDEFSARLVAMFGRMDANSDGVLAGDELPHRMGPNRMGQHRMGRHGHHHDGYRHGRDGTYATQGENAG